MGVNPQSAHSNSPSAAAWWAIREAVAADVLGQAPARNERRLELGLDAAEQLLVRVEHLSQRGGEPITGEEPLAFVQHSSRLDQRGAWVLVNGEMHRSPHTCVLPTLGASCQASKG
jgi:hypothetical protein